MNVEQEGQVRTFEETLEEESEGLVDAAKEYVEEEIREDPVIIVSADALKNMVESRGADAKLIDWANLSDGQKQAMKTKFQQMAEELQEIWQTQAEENDETCPKLGVEEVDDGIEIVAKFK